MNDPITTVSELIDFLSLLDGDIPVHTADGFVNLTPLYVPQIVEAVTYGEQIIDENGHHRTIKAFKAQAKHKGAIRNDLHQSGTEMVLLFR